MINKCMKNKPFKPTRLMVKKHTLTGMRYFCKTPRENYLKYTGSGVYWKDHIKKHGIEFVITEWVSEVFYNSDDIKEFALLFSELFNIVDSDNWANLKNEDGLEGGMSSQTAKEIWNRPDVRDKRVLAQKIAQNTVEAIETKRKNTKESWNNTNTRAVRTEKIKQKRTLQVMGPSPNKGKTFAEIHGNKATEVASRISIGLLNAGITRTEEFKENLRKPKEKVTCPHCGKVGGGGSMVQWHFDNCKSKKE